MVGSTPTPAPPLSEAGGVFNRRPGLWLPGTALGACAAAGGEA